MRLWRRRHLRLKATGSKWLPSLSDEIWYLILARVPAQNPLRLKGVCRSWHSEILRDEFKTLHYERWSSRLGSLAKTALKIKTSSGPKLSYNISYLNFEFTRNLIVQSHSLQLQSMVEGLIHKHRPKKYSDLLIKVLVSCNGLILLTVFRYYFSKDAIMLLVCNPVTRSCKPMHFWMPHAHPWRNEVGGEDVVEKCHWRIVPGVSLGKYKIVRFNAKGMWSDNCLFCDLELHKEAAKRSLCKELYFYPPSNDFPQRIKASLYVDGKLHWLSTDHRCQESSLISFDIETGKFCAATHFPEPYPQKGWCNWFDCRLASNGMFFQLRVLSDNTLEVWAVNDFNNRAWIRHQVTRLSNHYYSKNSCYPVRGMQPVAIIERGNKLLMRILTKYGMKMFACDMRSGEWKEIELGVKELAPPGADEWKEEDHYCVHYANALIGWTR